MKKRFQIPLFLFFKDRRCGSACPYETVRLANVRWEGERERAQRERKGIVGEYEEKEYILSLLCIYMCIPIYPPTHSYIDLLLASHLLSHNLIHSFLISLAPRFFAVCILDLPSGKRSAIPLYLSGHFARSCFVFQPIFSISLLSFLSPSHGFPVYLAFSFPLFVPLVVYFSLHV